MQTLTSFTTLSKTVRQKIGYDVFMNKYLEIEPRVLSIFRWFVGLGLALSVSGLLISQLIENQKPNVMSSKFILSTDVA